MKKVLKVIALFLLCATLTVAGSACVGFGLYALLTDDPRFAGVAAGDAAGWMAVGVLTVSASFLLGPRLMERVIK